MIAPERLCIAKRCQDTRNDSEGGSGPRRASHGHLCRRCYARIEKNLAETPALSTLARRTALAAGQGGTGDKIRHTKGNPPLPISVSVFDKLDLLVYRLGSWTQLVCEERDLRGPDHRNDVNATSFWLLHQLPWITDQPWVDDFDVELREDTAALRAALGLTVPWTRMELRCPYCGQQSLRRRSDAMADVVVRCFTPDCFDAGGKTPRWTRHTWALLLGLAS